MLLLFVSCLLPSCALSLQITRLLDNAAIDPDEVDGLKDDVEYYLDQAREEGFEPDLELYDAFDLTGAGAGAFAFVDVYIVLLMH